MLGKNRFLSIFFSCVLKIGGNTPRVHLLFKHIWCTKLALACILFVRILKISSNNRSCWVMLNSRRCAVQYGGWGVKTPRRGVFFALNMGHFYLASELPWGENCHVLAVLREPGSKPEQVLPKSAALLRTVWLSLRYVGIRRPRSKDRRPGARC